MASSVKSIDEFLQPLEVSVNKVHGLAKALAVTYGRLAKESRDQFLSTPISESVLRPERDGAGRFLAIDIGGTNLRVGFIELGSREENQNPNFEAIYSNGTRPLSRQLHQNGIPPLSRVRRHLEKSWPIGEQLKHNKPEDLFAWIGLCIAKIVRDGQFLWGKQLPDEIPLGVTFSFPMIQHTLSEATLMSMGKGFSLTSNSNLGALLISGYEGVKDKRLPKIRITAIVNDAVATLVSFAYQFQTHPHRKAAMGLIVGTGCNATIPLALKKLHPSKRPAQVKVGNADGINEETKITVNTEWSINGTAAPLTELEFVTKWDERLDREGGSPGFMPFEYMTAGRYLGELGRFILLDYFTTHLSIPLSSLPPKLLQRHGLTTSFLGNIGPHLSHIEPSLIRQLENELPPSTGGWLWTQDTAGIVFKISKAIQVRAAGMAAAATIGLLACADELQLSFVPSPISSPSALPIVRPIKPVKSAEVEELMVGYTGGCIDHFQDYLTDCQRFIDEILLVEYENSDATTPKVTLTPCHDGGIIGAGILAGTVVGLSHDETVRAPSNTFLKAGKA